MNWLNGKKTIIGGILLWLAGALLKLDLDASWAPVVIDGLFYVGGVLLPGGLIHKAVKSDTPTTKLPK